MKELTLFDLMRYTDKINTINTLLKTTDDTELIEQYEDELLELEYIINRGIKVSKQKNKFERIKNIGLRVVK